MTGKCVGIESWVKGSWEGVGEQWGGVTEWPLEADYICYKTPPIVKLARQFYWENTNEYVCMWLEIRFLGWSLITSSSPVTYFRHQMLQAQIAPLVVVVASIS